MKSYPLFRMANLLYRYAFWLYHPFYILYKYFSDRNAISILRHFIKPGSRIIDIGANIGSYTTRLARLTGSAGEVYAFEPHPRNFALLAKASKHLPVIKIHQAAISAQDGTLDLYVSDDLNVDHRTYPTSEKRKKQTVRCYSLDSFLREKPVDFIKMDIQGAEYQALVGMQRTLADNPKLAMLMELWPFGLNEAGATAAAVVELLRRNNFFLYLVLKNRVVEFSETLIEGRERDYYSLLATKEPLWPKPGSSGKP